MNLDPKYINALNLTVGPHRLRQLLKRFNGSAQNAWRAPTSSLAHSRMQQKGLQTLEQRRGMIDPKEAWEQLNQHGIKMLTIKDKAYPVLLKHTSSPPLALYVQGNTALISLPGIAVVGTRSPSRYGTSVVPRLVRELAPSGLSIISGLAQGIDGCAHKAALEYNAPTIAVLGCGLHQIYPLINKEIGRAIQARGALVSEYPLGTPPLKQHFPARNRIIAGLSLGVLVVESRKKGGALITAARAVEENREVFALPGPITHATSDGTNALIQEGAKLVSTADDILEELQPDALVGKQETLDITTLSDNERAIVQTLEKEPLHIDKIIKHVTLPAAIVNVVITSLELQGIIRNTGGGVYEKLL